MYILVTGGGGFLGTHLVHALLEAGHQVRTLTRSAQPALEALGVHTFRGDIADKDAVEKAVAGTDAVIHTAALAAPWGPEARFVATNVQGTQNVVDACTSHGVNTLVYTSTPSVVWGLEHTHNADESLPYPEAHLAAYPRTKAEAERRLRAADNTPTTTGTLRTVALRPHGIWGPGDTNLLPRIISKAKAGRLPILAGGKTRIDMTYVDNVVHAHMLALDKLKSAPDVVGGNAYFITDDAPLEIWPWTFGVLDALAIPRPTRKVPRWLAGAMAGLFETVWRTFRLGGDPPLTRYMVAVMCDDQTYNITAARRDLGYAPQVSAQAALDATLPYLRAQNDAGAFD